METGLLWGVTDVFREDRRGELGEGWPGKSKRCQM